MRLVPPPGLRTAPYHIPPYDSSPTPDGPQLQSFPIMSNVFNWQLGRDMDYPYEAAYPDHQFAFVFNLNR